MIVKPSIGTGGIYLGLIAFMSYQASREFFSGIWVPVVTLALVGGISYFKLPKFIKATEDFLTFEYFTGKSKVINYSDIHAIKDTGLGLFNGRILFVDGGWSDILNYSLLDRQSKREIIVKIQESIKHRRNPNKSL